MTEPPESDESPHRGLQRATLVPAPRRRVVVTRVAPGELSDPSGWAVHEEEVVPDDVVDALALEEAADRASERDAVEPLDADLVAQLQRFLPSLDETEPGEAPRATEPEPVVYVPLEVDSEPPRWVVPACAVVSIVVAGFVVGAWVAAWSGGS